MSFVAPVSIPQLAIPFQFGPNGQPLTVEQNSLDDVAACVAVILATPLGSRVDIPLLGVEDQTFSQTFDPGLLTAAVAEWEPRAVITVQVTPGRTDNVTVNVQLAAGVADTDSSGTGVATLVPGNLTGFDGGEEFDTGWTWDS